MSQKKQKFKVGYRVKVRNNYFSEKFRNQIGTIVKFNIYGDPRILFDNNQLNINYRRDSARTFYIEDLELYTMDQTKRNLLDE